MCCDLHFFFVLLHSAISVFQSQLIKHRLSSTSAFRVSTVFCFLFVPDLERLFWVSSNFVFKAVSIGRGCWVGTLGVCVCVVHTNAAPPQFSDQMPTKANSWNLKWQSFRPLHRLMFVLVDSAAFHASWTHFSLCARSVAAGNLGVGQLETIS